MAIATAAALPATSSGFRLRSRGAIAGTPQAATWPPPPFLGRRRGQAPSLIVRAAKKGGGKKGGGKKGGGKKKGPGSLMDIGKKKGPFEDVTVVMQNLLMVESFRRNVGRPLMEDVEINDAAKAMFQADFVMITCDRGLSENPKIVYVNEEGLKLLGKTWEEVIDSLASSILKLEELSEAQDRGVLEGYCGAVETASGTVMVKDATVWTVESPAIVGGEEGADDVEATKTSRGKIMGQGIVFKEWTLPDGTAAGVGVTNVTPPSAEELEQAEQAVNEQGDLVRSLKESGLTNQDSKVQDAVEELLLRKARLAEMQDLVTETASQ